MPVTDEKEKKNNLSAVAYLISFVVLIGLAALLVLNLSPRQDENISKTLEAFSSETKNKKKLNDFDFPIKELKDERVKIENDLLEFTWAIEDSFLTTYKFPKLTNIRFDRSNVTEEGLRYLPENIENLQFNDTPITNAMLDVIVSRFPGLQTISFNKSVEFPENGIDKLKQAKALSSLTFLKHKQAYTRKEFKAISELKKLAFLSIEGNSITPSLIAQPNSLPELIHLELRYVDFSESLLKAVAKLPKLKTLSLVCCNFKSHDLLALSGSNIDHLIILRGSYSPGDLSIVRKLKNVTRLEVSDTPANRRTFEQMNGKMKVIFVKHYTGDR